MPRYFLHIREGGEIVKDEEGSELPDLDAARAEALQSAREILAEQLRKGEPPTLSVMEIAGASGDLLAVVELEVAINVKFR